MRRLVTLVLILAGVVFAQGKDGIPFRVRVLNKLSGTPVAGASVVLSGIGTDQVSGRTNAGGGFEGQVAPGKYLLNVSRMGYTTTDETGTVGKQVEIRSGAPKETVVYLLQLGVIAGRILDQFGDPIRGAIVRSIDRRSQPQGSYDGFEGFSAADTDDRGEYRITNVEPGRHYVAVEFDSENRDLYSGARSRFRWPRMGGYVFYPDTLKIEDAQQVEVASGQVTRIKDLRLNMRGAVSVSGRIVPPPQAKTTAVQLEPAAGRLGLNVTVGRNGSSESDGSFKLKALPGTYLLHAADQQTGKLSQPVRLELGDKDVSGIELRLQLNYEIAGRVVVDGQEKLDFSTLHLSLLDPNDKIDTSGTFHVNLLGNQGFWVLQGLPDGWYVKDVVVGGKHITGKMFDVQPGTTDFALIVSPRAARLEVSLESGGDASDAVYVFMLPPDAPSLAPESAPSAQRDADGRFTFPALPPGSYRVFSLDVTHWALAFSPSILLEKYGSVAPLITLAEGDRKSITIRPTKFDP